MNIIPSQLFNTLKALGKLFTASIGLSLMISFPASATVKNYRFSGVTTFFDTASFTPVVPAPVVDTILTGRYIVDSSNQSFSNFSLTYSGTTINYRNGFLRSDGSLFAIPVGGLVNDITFSSGQSIPAIPTNAFLPSISLSPAQPVSSALGLSILELRQPVSFDAGCNDNICNVFLFPGTVAQATVRIQDSTTQRYTPEQKAKFLNAAKVESKIADSIGSFPISATDFQSVAQDKVGSILFDRALGNALGRKVGVGLPNPTSVTGILGLGAGVSALVPGGQVLAPVFGGAALGFSALGSLIQLQSYQSLLRALDPPDPNYTIIEQPTLSLIPGYPFAANDPLAEPAAKATNELLNNLLTSISIAHALQTSLDRADGAALAGDTFWEQQQLNAANLYKSCWGISCRVVKFLLFAIRLSSHQVKVPESSSSQHQTVIKILGAIPINRTHRPITLDACKRIFTDNSRLAQTAIFLFLFLA